MVSMPQFLHMVQQVQERLTQWLELKKIQEICSWLWKTYLLRWMNSKGRTNTWCEWAFWKYIMNKFEILLFAHKKYLIWEKIQKKALLLQDFPKSKWKVQKMSWNYFSLETKIELRKQQEQMKLHLDHTLFYKSLLKRKKELKVFIQMWTLENFP